VKEKQTYKRFDLLAFLAILGCIGMLLFECFFIFELYDRVPLQPETPAPAKPAPEVKAPAVSAAPAAEKPVGRESAEPVRRETVEPAPAIESSVPPVTNVAPPVSIPPAEPEKAPASFAPVG